MVRSARRIPVLRPADRIDEAYAITVTALDPNAADHFAKGDTAHFEPEPSTA